MQDMYNSLIDDIWDESKGTKDQVSNTGKSFEIAA